LGTARAVERAAAKTARKTLRRAAARGATGKAQPGDYVRSDIIKKLVSGS
jgi:hypothetical protein